MKKTNVIITAIIVVVSVLLLCLWYMLGLNTVDQPLDLVISVVWWVLIAIGIALTVKFEKDRRQRIRTVYLADGRMYNSETGMVMVTAGAPLTDAIAGTLARLEYDFDRVSAPDQSKPEEHVDYRYVVRTSEFKPADRNGSQGDSETWEGEVVTVATGDVRRFSSRSELAALIA